MLAAVTEPPEQVVPVDPQNPSGAFANVRDFETCALIADPAAARGLSWSLTVCPRRSDLRCDPARPLFVAGQGHLDDPDLAPVPVRVCATVPAGGALLAVIRDALERDSLQGFGGLDINLSLRVVPDGGGEADAVYSSKAARFSVQLPADRVANTNPTLARIDVDVGGAEPVALPLGRCVDQAAPIEVALGGRIHLMPIEPPGAREDYVVPTFEGGSRRFTENLRYQWLAGGGDWTRASTGGTRDGAGNEPELDTEWKPPTAAQLDEAGLTLPTLMPLWVIERDERGGTAWFESCARVVP